MFNLDIRSFFKDVALSIENPLKRTFFALIGLLEDLERERDVYSKHVTRRDGIIYISA